MILQRKTNKKLSLWYKNVSGAASILSFYLSCTYISITEDDEDRWEWPSVSVIFPSFAWDKLVEIKTIRKFLKEGRGNSLCEICRYMIARPSPTTNVKLVVYM